MTFEQLDEIEKLAEAATPGPWNHSFEFIHPNDGGISDSFIVCRHTEGGYDAAFLCAMREYALPLVKELREARIAATRQTERLMQSEELTDLLHKERDDARAEMDDFAVAVGYGERPEGQSGVHRLHGAQLAARWKQIEREHDESRAEVERLKSLSDTMQDLAEGDCAYGDNCPSNAGTRHGTCDQCKAREALNKAGIPLRNCEVVP